MRDVQVEMPSGDLVWVQLRDNGQAVNVGATDVLQKLDLADLKTTVRGVSDSMRQALAGLRPDEVSIAFGVQLEIKTGKLTSVLAEASGSASITVTVGWRHDPTAEVERDS